MKKLVCLTIRRGEYEFRDFILCSPQKNPENVARDFYGDGKGQKADGGYYFNGGEIHVSVRSVSMVAEEHVALLNEFGIC